MLAACRGWIEKSTNSSEPVRHCLTGSCTCLALVFPLCPRLLASFHHFTFQLNYRGSGFPVNENMNESLFWILTEISFSPNTVLTPDHSLDGLYDLSSSLQFVSLQLSVSIFPFYLLNKASSLPPSFIHAAELVVILSHVSWPAALNLQQQTRPYEEKVKNWQKLETVRTSWEEKNTEQWERCEHFSDNDEIIFKNLHMTKVKTCKYKIKVKTLK